MYLKNMSDLRKSHKPSPACSDDAPHIRDEGKKTLVFIHHDESIYSSNEGLAWMWAEEDHPAILPNGRLHRWTQEGTSLYFQKNTIKQFPGIPVTARVKLVYGGEREGLTYWMGECFMDQVKNICDTCTTAQVTHVLLCLMRAVQVPWVCSTSEKDSCKRWCHVGWTPTSNGPSWRNSETVENNNNITRERELMTAFSKIWKYHYYYYWKVRDYGGQ